MKKVVLGYIIFLNFLCSMQISGQELEFEMNCEQYYCLDKDEKLKLNFELEEEGEYYINVQYLNSDNLFLKDQISIKSDNQKIENYNLNTEYEYVEDFGVDRYNNDVIPMQQVSLESQETNFNNHEFFFEKGNNEIEIVSHSDNIKIEKVEVVKITNENFKYEALENNVDEQYIIEAENFKTKNDIQTNVRVENSIDVTPIIAGTNKLNVIDETTFNKDGKTITYELNVEKSGYYTVSANMKNFNQNKLNAYINIYVNGEIQNELHENITISALKDYEVLSLSTPIYLNEGINEIEIEIESELFNHALEISSEIQKNVENLTKEIVKITGGIVDEKRDWQLTEYIPDLKEQLENMLELANELKIIITEHSNSETNEALNTVDLIINNLNILLLDVDNIANNMELLTTQTTSILSLIIKLQEEIKTSMISIDKIYITGYKEKIIVDNMNFIDKTTYYISDFLSSFKVQENDELKYEEEIEVWVKKPRQYVDVMQSMSDELYTPNSNIKVNFSIMTDQNKITMANAANEQPDIVMGIDSWYAYELGIRGAFVDVNDFEQTKDIVSTMSYGGMIPMIINDSMYGIAETQDVNVMFYRTDIFENLNLDVPSTWSDVLEILPVLQANAMNFYLPFSGGTSLKSFASTYPFFTQSDTNLYTEDSMQSTLEDPKTYNVLKSMVDLYTVYGMSLNVTNFYDSFREGTIPIGVANFSTYIQLSYAAPELANKWSIAPIPGIVKSDNSIDRSFTGGQSVSSVFSKSKMKTQSIEFLSWWTSTDVQTEFQNRLISTYGQEYLHNSANNEAFLNLPLPEEHLEVFSIQLEQIEEAPKTPGGYYLERAISDIFNSAVYEGENIRLAINEQVDIVNDELQRKYIEFDYVDENKKQIKDYIIPTTKSIEEFYKEDL